MATSATARAAKRFPSSMDGGRCNMKRDFGRMVWMHAAGGAMVRAVTLTSAMAKLVRF